MRSKPSHTILSIAALTVSLGLGGCATAPSVRLNALQAGQPTVITTDAAVILIPLKGLRSQRLKRLKKPKLRADPVNRVSLRTLLFRRELHGRREQRFVPRTATSITLIGRVREHVQACVRDVSGGIIFGDSSI